MKKTKRFISIILVLAMLFTAVTATMLNASASGEYRYWKQYDDRWKYQWIGGDNGDTVWAIGCAMTSLAMLLVHTEAVVDDEAQFNPGIFATWLNANGGFTDGGAIYWGTGASYGSGFSYAGQTGLSGTIDDKCATIQGLMDEGYCVEIAVKYEGHWVACNYVDGSTINMFDPANTSEDLFSTYDADGVTRAVYYSCPNNKNHGGGSDPDPEPDPVYASPTKLDDDTLLINSCDSTDGWSGDYDTRVLGCENRIQGTGSVLIYGDNATGFENQIGAMGRCAFGSPVDASGYEYISFNYYLASEFSNQPGGLQLNFCTDNVDDGFNIFLSIDNDHIGWHTYRIRKDDISRAKDEADWSRITNLRYTWWNYCQRGVVDILIDNITAYNTSSPSGNIMKIDYSNGDTENPFGYKYVDLALANIMTGWKLVYDVYLENDVAGIGGIELEDKYGNYARDSGEFYDQNGLRGHPSADLSDYAYHQWYHRVVDLPDGWNGDGFAMFYMVPAFDGFVGNATAYFDNIKYVDENGNNVEFFFGDGGDEYVYVGDNYVGNGDGISVSIVSLDSVFGQKKVDNVINAINALPDAAAITNSNRDAINYARSLYNELSDELKGGVTNYSRLTAAEAALAANMYGSANPSGNVLKVNYANGDASLTAGYQFLDLALCTVYADYKLVYDVYLDNDVAGIGGLDLDDGYGLSARDSGEFVDTNGISGHPSSDLTDYAYHKWYHRVVDLPNGWSGDGFARFFTLLAFDGGFTGNATAYFDNIKFMDGAGNNVEFFFENGGDEYVYVGSYKSTEGQVSDYSDTHWDYMNVSIVDVSEVGSNIDSAVDNTISLINALPDSSNVSLANTSAIKAARAAYNALNATQQGNVTNYSRLAAAEAALANISIYSQYQIMKDLDNIDGLIDSCGHPYSCEDGKLVVNHDGGAHGIAYVRVGSDGSSYVTSFDYNNYYQAETLAYSDNAVNFRWSSGNENNQQEYQYMADVHADTGWSLVTVPVSSLTSASSECPIGIDNVNLVFFTYGSDGVPANTFKFDNIALVTKAYADARAAAKTAFINAVAAISSGSDISAISNAAAKKAEVEKYINYASNDYLAAASTLSGYDTNAKFEIMKNLDNLDGIIDSCGHPYSCEDGKLVVNHDGGAHGIAYVRVGSDGSNYVTSFNYNNYYQAETLTYSDNAVDFKWSSGNENNQQEYQYMADVHADAGWSLVTVPVSSLTSASSECPIGIDNVNLVFFTYGSDGVPANTFKFDDIALVTKAYADARAVAKTDFINAVNAISSAADTAAIDNAKAKKATAEGFINYATNDYLTAVTKLKGFTNPPAQAAAEGNILKVVYNNNDTQITCGYQFLDLADATIHTGYKLSYDVYLCDDIAGIGGLDLDDGYDTYARDSSEFVDQNGISGHPNADISDYAYHKWYHREVSLPGGWDGTGFAEFFTLLSFDGSFSGTATAYFDNIKLIDADGNDVEYFFLNGGEEYSYVNAAMSTKGQISDYSDTQWDQINASVVDLVTEFTPHTAPIVTVAVMLNGSAWADNAKTITLRSGATVIAATNTGSSLKFTAENGTYKIYDGETDTGVSVTVNSADTSATVNYYTITLADNVSATYGGSAVTNGTVVLGGKTLVLTAKTDFDDGISFYSWSTGVTSKSVSTTDIASIPTVTIKNVLWADMNNDGNVDVADALIALQISVDKITASAEQSAVGDVDENGNVSSSDALYILQYSVGILNTFPIQ